MGGGKAFSTTFSDLCLGKCYHTERILQFQQNQTEVPLSSIYQLPTML